MAEPDLQATGFGDVPCAFCRGPIPADSFTYWSEAKRLLSAPCPECHRRVTLAATTWHRWASSTPEQTA
jgi:hypothetical protein